MAAYMRSMICLVSKDRNAFFKNGGVISVESVRYIRGLRRKPVKVLFPENETDKGPYPTPQTQPAGLNIKRERDAKVTATTRHHEASDFVKVRTNVHSATVDDHVIVKKDHIDGLRFERAFPGDKRLA